MKLINKTYSAILAGLVSGIALTLLWGQLPYSDGLQYQTEGEVQNNEPALKADHNNATHVQNPFSTPEENSVDYKVNAEPDNLIRTNTGSLEIQNHHQLLNALQWLQQAEYFEIADLAATLFNQQQSLPDRETNRHQNSSYKQSWLQAVLTRWLEVDANTAMNFLLSNNHNYPETEQQYLTHQLVNQLLRNYAEQEPQLLSIALASIDPQEVISNQLLLDLQMKIDPDKVLAQLDSLPDNQTKMMAYANYALEMARDDPQAAIDWLLQQGNGNDRIFRSISPGIYYQWAESDPRGLIAQYNPDSADPMQLDILSAAYISLASDAPLEAMALIDQLPDDQSQMARMSVFSDWAYTDSKAAGDWMQQAVQNGEIDIETIPPFMLGNLPPQIALSIAELMPGEQRSSIVLALAQRYVGSEPQQFEEFLAQLPDQQSRDTARLVQLPQLAETSPLEALNQLGTSPVEIQSWVTPQVVATIEYQSPQILDDWLSHSSITEELRLQINSMRRGMAEQGFYPDNYWQQQISVPVDFSGER